jgi:hypothetical protein
MATIKEKIRWRGDENRIRCHFVVNPFGVISHCCENVNGENGITVREYRVTRAGMGNVEKGTLVYVCNRCVVANKKFFDFHSLSLNAKRHESTFRAFFVRKENGEKVAILKDAIGILDSSRQIIERENLEQFLGKRITVVYANVEDNDEGILTDK